MRPLFHQIILFPVIGLLSILHCPWNSPCRSADWPQWRGPGRDSVAEAITITDDTKLEPVWTAEVGTGFSSLAVVGQSLYTMGNVDGEESLWSLNAASGEVNWRHRYDCPLDPNLFEGGPTSTPTWSEGAIYTLSRRGDVYCLDAATGEVKWQHQLVNEHQYSIPAWGFSSSPLIAGNLVIYNIGSAGLALNRETGELVWKSDDSDEAGYTSPVALQQHGSAAVILLSGKKVNAIDPETGTVLWSHPWVTRYGVNAADPQLLKGQLLLSSGYGKGSALLSIHDAGAEELWRSREIRNQLSPGIVVENNLYAFDGDAGGDSEFVCFSIDQQQRLWAEQGLGTGTLIRSGESLLILSEQGELVVAPVSAQGFKPVFRQQVITGRCWTMPVLSSGRFFCRNAAGQIVCLKFH